MVQKITIYHRTRRVKKGSKLLYFGTAISGGFRDTTKEVDRDTTLYQLIAIGFNSSPHAHHKQVDPMPGKMFSDNYWRQRSVRCLATTWHKGLQGTCDDYMIAGEKVDGNWCHGEKSLKHTMTVVSRLCGHSQTVIRQYMFFVEDAGRLMTDFTWI